MLKLSARLHEASEALNRGDRDAAWKLLQPALHYPAGAEMSDVEFAQCLGMFEGISADSMRLQTLQALAQARQEPADVQLLFNTGFLLLKEDAPQVAATALARANALAANIPALVNELATALAKCGLYMDAYLALQIAYGARQQDWHSRYLYSFNALMSGHLIEARQSFSLLGAPQDDASHALYDQLVRSFARHRSIAAGSSLDEHDLRGWHHVITGGMLTHLSSESDIAGTHGRYGLVRDSDELVHEGLIRAIAVLQSWDACPDALVYSPDRSSEILAHCWNRRLGLDIRPFGPTHAAGPALFVAYDLAHAHPDFLEAMTTRQPGQTLLSHASCWTNEAAFTSDISTYLYDVNIESWDADVDTPVELAARICGTTVAQDALADLDDLTQLAQLAGPPPSVGQRDHFYFGSPVQTTLLG